MICFIQSQAEMITRHRYRNWITKRSDLLHNDAFAWNAAHFHEFYKDITIIKFANNSFITWLEL